MIFLFILILGMMIELLTIVVGKAEIKIPTTTSHYVSIQRAWPWGMASFPSVGLVWYISVPKIHALTTVQWHWHVL